MLSEIACVSGVNSSTSVFQTDGAGASPASRSTKEKLSIRRVSKTECKEILARHHYLSTISKGFKSGFNYGLFYNDSLVGVCIFTGFPVPELAVGLFGLPKNTQEGLFELSRLCLDPEVQKTEHNLASWFVSRCLKSLRKETSVKAVLSYADSGFHTGTVYAAANFGYYGLSAEKKDFWIDQGNGTFVKHSRGKMSGMEGEWRPRNRKHRFLIVYDVALVPKWEKQKWAKQ